MPTYEYRCENGHQYEKREGFDAPSKQKCPTCKAMASRLLFAPPVVFKGSGFYKTDNRGSSGGSNGSSAAAETAKSTSDSGESASDSKGDSKGESKGNSKGNSTTDTAPESAAAS